jgi:GntR family transcriptional regulator
MQAVNASPEDAELLGVEPGTALIEVIRESRDASGRLIEHVRARYLGSTYIYRISFAPSSHGENHDLTRHEAARPGRRLGAPADRL